MRDIALKDSIKRKFHEAYRLSFVYGKASLLIGANDMTDEMLEISQYTDKIPEKTIIILDEVIT